MFVRLPIRGCDDTSIGTQNGKGGRDGNIIDETADRLEGFEHADHRRRRFALCCKTSRKNDCKVHHAPCDAG